MVYSYNRNSYEGRLQNGTAPSRQGPKAQEDMREHYRRLRLRLILGLIVAYLVPLSILSIYFHFQFDFVLKKRGRLHLATLARSQRNVVDLFLQERLTDLFNLWQNKALKAAPTPVDMRLYLRHLRKMNEAFFDVSYLNNRGIQVAYAGPYTFLQGKNYHHETWFQSLMSRKKNYYISDVYKGFRKKHHFTIATRQQFNGQTYIIRATLDPDKFYVFLRSTGQGRDIETSVINRGGKYQLVDPHRAGLQEKSVYRPKKQYGSGTWEIATRRGRVLVAYAWMREVPWAIVIEQPLIIAYAELFSFRKRVITITLLLTLFLLSFVWLGVNRFLRRAQSSEEARLELRSQLIHAGKLMSVGELASGIAHEINNPLAIISSESGLIRDMLNPEFGFDSSPESILQELEHVDQAVFRARDITQKLLNFVRKKEPQLVPTNLHELLDDLTSGLMEKEYEVDNIKLVRDYAPSLHSVLVDPDQLRQVFLNLLNNARDAISPQGGEITLATRNENDKVSICVTDTGTGMTHEQLEKIFLPFFTTKEVGKGTGLGLSISLNIIQAMEGTIEVQSIPGMGSSFTVLLPYKIDSEEKEK